MNRLILFTAFLILFSSCLKKPDYHIDISYTGEQLRYIQCPIVGNGSTSVVLNGYGGMSGLNQNSKSAKDDLPLDITFFSLYVKTDAGDTVVRILEREYLNEYPGPAGIDPHRLGGLPRFKEAVFHNAYPIIRIDLIDEQVPLDVTMESWSPYTPLDQDYSKSPCLIVDWELTNPGKTSTDYSLAFSVMPLQTESVLYDSSKMIVSIPGKAVLSTPLYVGDWRDKVQFFWDDFSEDGKLNLGSDSLILPGKNEEMGAICWSGSLEPGESIRIPVLFSWYDSIQQHTEISENLDLLREKTRLFSEAIITSSVPPAIIDASISNLPSSRTLNSLFHIDNISNRGKVLEERMRIIMEIYRHWKITGNNEWLGEIWPELRYTLESAWEIMGDPNKDGVLRLNQPGFYNEPFVGLNMMNGSLYLSVLKASSEMAIMMNEPQNSLEYNEIYKKGVQKYTDLLWNGKYFIQEVKLIDSALISDQSLLPADEKGLVFPTYQYGDGCLSSQLLGQYLAFVSGMGYIMDTAIIRTTLMSIYENNFKEEMREVENAQRTFASNDEAGLLNCTWPDGKKPAFPFVYAGEVWNALEYQVAASLIFAGMREEGIRIMQASRARYKGNNRNPFAKLEPPYYHSSLASWSVYKAIAGYQYDGTREIMKFAPAEDVLPIRYFWSTNAAWGTIEASRAKIELICLHGEIDIMELDFFGKSFFVFREFDVSEHCEVKYQDGALKILFPKRLRLMEGESFLMSLP